MQKQDVIEMTERIWETGGVKCTGMNINRGRYHTFTTRSLDHVSPPLLAIGQP